LLAALQPPFLLRNIAYYCKKVIVEEQLGFITPIFATVVKFTAVKIHGL